MQQIVLTREQIFKLTVFASQLPEVNEFTIESDCASGIGERILAKCDLFAKNDATLDISEYDKF